MIQELQAQVIKLKEQIAAMKRKLIDTWGTDEP